MSRVSWSIFSKLRMFGLSALCIALSFGALAAETTKSNALIPKDRQAIIGSSVYNRPTWTPTEAQTDMALAAIRAYLQAALDESVARARFSDAKKAAFIMEHLDEFAVQFQGVGYGDSRKIWCNFFPVDAHPEWKKNTVFRSAVSEALYWNILYVPEDNDCREFSYKWVKL